MLKIKKSKPYHPHGKLEKNLVRAFLNQKSELDMASFLRDLLTTREMQEFANRVEVAKLLTQGMSYLDIAHKLHVSTTTVTRVAHWITNGHGGYTNAVKD